MEKSPAVTRICKYLTRRVAFTGLAGAIFSTLIMAASAGDGIRAESTQRQAGGSQASGDTIVALSRGRPITATELDASIRMQLHDLDLARYQLRLQQLKQLVDRDDAKIYLQPPQPPRFAVEGGNNEILGAPEAPITIVQFLDYQSPYSKRAQPLLLQVLGDYGPLVRLVTRDNPLSFHRNARQAALAGECARQQGVFWHYHDRLLQNQDRLDTENLKALATTMDLAAPAFEACLNDIATEAALEDDLAAAARLRLSSSPVYFVNGLYHKGLPHYGDISRLVNGELVRLGILSEKVVRNMDTPVSPFRAAVRSASPLVVTGTFLREDPLESSAVLGEPPAGNTRTRKWGDVLAGSGKIVLVTRDRVYLEREGRLTFLESAESSIETGSPEAAVAPAGSVDAVIRLRRSDLQYALSRPQDLEEALATGSLDVEGKRLLKLTEVEPGSLFDLLGLQERDVLMQVDGAWIHNQQNSLWGALRTRRSVKLTIMRRGLPQTFQYLLEDGPG